MRSSLRAGPLAYAEYLQHSLHLDRLESLVESL